MDEQSQLDTQVEETEELDQSEESEELNQGEESDQDGESQDPQEGQGELTEKGTRLDPDEKTALHQQLANERRARMDTEERALRILEAYQKTQEPQKPKEEDKPLIDVSRLENAEDVRNAFAQAEKVIRSYKDELDTIKGQLGQSTNFIQENENYSRLQSEITSVRSMPELQPGSPKYSEHLEQRIHDGYKKIAYDQYGRLQLNRPSLEDYASNLVETFRLAQKAGSSQAQKRVVQKTMGRSNSNNKRVTTDSTEGLSPTERLEVEMEKLGF
jgi:hypothetical protein